jgi:hypothetical protein
MTVDQECQIHETKARWCDENGLPADAEQHRGYVRQLRRAAAAGQDTQSTSSSDVAAPVSLKKEATTVQKNSVSGGKKQTFRDRQRALSLGAAALNRGDIEGAHKELEKGKPLTAPPVNL